MEPVRRLTNAPKREVFQSLETVTYHRCSCSHRTSDTTTPAAQIQSISNEARYRKRRTCGKDRSCTYSYDRKYQDLDWTAVVESNSVFEVQSVHTEREIWLGHMLKTALLIGIGFIQVVGPNAGCYTYPRYRVPCELDLTIHA